MYPFDPSHPLRPMTIERIHELGAKRHGGTWLGANIRAVEALSGSSTLRVTDDDTKRTVAEIVLRVLDYASTTKGKDGTRRIEDVSSG